MVTSRRFWVHTHLYVSVFVVTSGRPWCTCMFMCAHMVISGETLCTYISVCVCVCTCVCVCVLTWSYSRPWCTHVVVCVHAMWSHPGRPRYTMSVYACSCTHIQHQTSLQLRWTCLSLMPKAKASFTSCLTPQFHQALEEKEQQGKGRAGPRGYLGGWHVHNRL